MRTVGIICEYNPFHLGHASQIGRVRQILGADTGIICLMSGNFVQRGQPAVFPKAARAEAALRCGADLVLELPVTRALSSAEGFAAGGVEILSACGAEYLCFGVESGTDPMETARLLESPDFSPALRQFLDRGMSFPAARAAALGELGMVGELLRQPNDILGAEYCKAILRQKSPMSPLPIRRPGSYHAAEPDRENPSATALRNLILEGKPWRDYTPVPAAEILACQQPHTMAAGERAVLSRLRTMEDEEFEALPYGSEGLWRKLMAACRRGQSVEEILELTKSKRYTRTRLERMVLCAFLGLTARELEEKPPYVRVLALNDRGRELVRAAREKLRLVNAGERLEEPYYAMECRCSELYGLFAVDRPDPPGQEKNQRVVYLPGL